MTLILDLCMALVLLVLGVLIYKGNIDIILKQFRKNVKDEKGYCRSIGKAVMLMSLPVVLSGIGSCIITDGIAVLLSSFVMVLGIALCLVLVWIACKKYN